MFILGEQAGGARQSDLRAHALVERVQRQHDKTSTPPRPPPTDAKPRRRLREVRAAIMRFILSHKLNTKLAANQPRQRSPSARSTGSMRKTAVPIHWLKIVQIKSCGSIKHTAKTARSSCLSQTRGEVSSAFCIGHLAAGTGLRERVFVSVGPCDHWPHDEIREIGGLQGLFHVANLIRVPQAQRRA